MTHQCLSSPLSGLVRCQTAPNIFPSANEFAKGKIKGDNLNSADTARF